MSEKVPDIFKICDPSLVRLDSRQHPHRPHRLQLFEKSGTTYKKSKKTNFVKTLNIPWLQKYTKGELYYFFLKVSGRDFF